MSDPTDEARAARAVSPTVSVRVMDQNSVTALISGLANPQNHPQPPRARAENAGNTAAIRDALDSRDKRRDVLARLGITPDTAASYRLAIYTDGNQSVAFIGNVDGQGNFQSTSRIILPTQSANGGQASDLDALKALVTQAVGRTQGERAITIPIGNSTTRSGEIEGVQIRDVQLTPEQQRSLATRVTLLASTEQFHNGGGALAQTNDKLPQKLVSSKSEGFGQEL
jgi:hypothetical protein